MIKIDGDGDLKDGRSLDEVIQAAHRASKTEEEEEEYSSRLSRLRDRQSSSSSFSSDDTRFSLPYHHLSSSSTSSRPCQGSFDVDQYQYLSPYPPQPHYSSSIYDHHHHPSPHRTDHHRLSSRLLDENPFFLGPPTTRS